MSSIPCTLAIQFGQHTCTSCAGGPHEVDATDIRHDVAMNVADWVRDNAAYLKGSESAMALHGDDVLLVFGETLIAPTMEALQVLSEHKMPWRKLNAAAFSGCDPEVAMAAAMAEHKATGSGFTGPLGPVKPTHDPLLN